VIWMSPQYWSCPACGNSTAWILCDGALMCEECNAYFASRDDWVAGRSQERKRDDDKADADSSDPGVQVDAAPA
jgi:hypothetical protein